MTTVMQRRALIFGASGQDGFYLARSLQADGWEVVAVVRDNHAIQALPVLDKVTYIACDLTQPADLKRIIDSVDFYHAYNLAGFSSVKACWSDPQTCHEINAAVAIQIMSLIHNKILSTATDVRLFQASSAEIFGCTHTPHSEATPMKPINPYGVAKLMAHREVVRYREEFGHHFVAAIMNCHESPLRSARFVSRRICQGIAAIACGRASELSLGNVAAVRDWGHALDYVLAMRLMLDADTPADYVVSTGVGRSIKDLVDAFAESAGLSNDRSWLAYDHLAARPADVPALIGDSSRIRLDLGWQPRITFQQLVNEMLSHDLARLRGQPEKIGDFQMFESL